MNNTTNRKVFRTTWASNKILNKRYDVEVHFELANNKVAINSVYYSDGKGRKVNLIGEIDNYTIENWLREEKDVPYSEK